MYEQILQEGMTEKGYLRVYDLDSNFSTEFVDNQYRFVISVYGIYVGKKIAKCSDGIFGNRVIRMAEMDTADHKLDQSYPH
jgi:hypothetical protein